MMTQGDTRIGRFARCKPLTTFFLLAYLIGWIGFLPLVLTNIGLGVLHANVPIQFVVLGTFSPTIAALITQWLAYGNVGICGRIGSWLRMFLMAILGIALVLAAFVIVPALLLAKPSPAALHWPALWTLSAYSVNWSTFLGGPIGEEPGWRGFALPRLEKRFGPVVGSVVLGLLWAGWHLPLFLIHFVSVPVWAFALILIFFSLLITLAANLAHFSVIVPVLMHATFNCSSKVLAALSIGVETRKAELLVYLCATGLAAMVAVLLTNGTLGFRRAAAEQRSS